MEKILFCKIIYYNDKKLYEGSIPIEFESVEEADQYIINNKIENAFITKYYKNPYKNLKCKRTMTILPPHLKSKNIFKSHHSKVTKNKSQRNTISKKLNRVNIKPWKNKDSLYCDIEFLEKEIFHRKLPRNDECEKEQSINTNK